MSQHLIDLLKQFTDDWGLTVNLGKTEIMVFNTSGRILKCSEGFSFGRGIIKPYKNYTYSGITLSLTGSYKLVIANLRSKALRAYFSMRKVIDWKYLRRTNILKLIDVLIKPILMYGCEIWLPYVAGTIIIEIQASSKSPMPSRTMPRIGKLAFEQVHLQMMNWVLAVNKKTSN